MKKLAGSVTIRCLFLGCSDPCCKLLGARPRANSRPSCQDLRHRFVGSSRGDPLHLERRNYRTLQSCSQVGVGAQDQ